MDMKTAQTNATAKLPILKQGPVTTEEKAQKKNDVKAQDAKTFFDAYKRKFNGIICTRRLSKILLKRMYENFNAPSTYTAKLSVRYADSPDSTANLSDATVYAFLANQPNGSQLVHEDLEQIHEDDLEEMDLKWQLALLSMRARRNVFKSVINGTFLQGNAELRGIKRIGTGIKTLKRTVNVEETSSKAMVAIDGAGFDWSFMADEEVPTNMALMAFSDSEHVLFVEALTMYKLTAITINGKGWNMTPRAVLMKTGLKPLNTARPVNTAHPKTIVYSARPMSFNTAKPKAVNTARPTSAVVNAVRTNQEFDGGSVTFGGGTPEEKNYCRFTWVFFLASKDETSGILKNFITEIENLVDKKVKIIRCDNGTEFKNRVMNEFCEQKGIKREYSVARTPQQNGVAERRNRTLIEAARTMLADSKLPTTFWAEAVNTACYVQNRVIIVKPHNKTPYELFRGRTPALSFMRPFGCHVSILNTLDHLGKFDGKSDDGFFVGYSLTSTNSNGFPGSKVSIGEGSTSKETDTSQDYIVMPLWKDSSLIDSPSMNVSHDEPELSCDAEKKDDEGVSKESGVDDQEKPERSTPNINTVGPSINTASANLKTGSLHINTVISTVITTRSNRSQTISDIFSLRDNVTSEATHADLFGDETEMDMSNLNASYQVPITPNKRIHKDHSLDHVIDDIQSGVQTRGMTKTANEQGFLNAVYEGKPHEDLYTCMFFCFL
ncbi:putative ribonuclease H-like domain-containing protein, partial [Tanacetum coccineum]